MGEGCQCRSKDPQAVIGRSRGPGPGGVRPLRRSPRRGNSWVGCSPWLCWAQPDAHPQGRNQDQKAERQRGRRSRSWAEGPVGKFPVDRFPQLFAIPGITVSLAGKACSSAKNLKTFSLRR